MSTDPMTSYEQAEVEATERADEARREQHFAEAEAAVLDVLQLNNTVSDVILLTGTEWDPYTPAWRLLLAFRADYGLPALLRVIARALESSK